MSFLLPPNVQSGGNDIANRAKENGASLAASVANSRITPEMMQAAQEAGSSLSDIQKAATDLNPYHKRALDIVAARIAKDAGEDMAYSHILKAMDQGVTDADMQVAYDGFEAFSAKQRSQSTGGSHLSLVSTDDLSPSN